MYAYLNQPVIAKNLPETDDLILICKMDIIVKIERFGKALGSSLKKHGILFETSNNSNVEIL